MTIIIMTLRVVGLRVKARSTSSPRKLGHDKTEQWRGYGHGRLLGHRPGDGPGTGSGGRALLVEPGVTCTSFEENLTRADRPLPVYAVERTRSESLMRTWVEAGDPPQVVADTVVKAATARKPKLRYSAGKQSHQVRTLRRFMPEGLVDGMLRKFNGFAA